MQEGDSIDSTAVTFGVSPDGIRRSSYLPTGENLEAGPASGNYDSFAWDEFSGMWQVLEGKSMAVYLA